MIALEETNIELNRNNDLWIEKNFYSYYPRLYNFSKKFLKKEDGINDILQEAFIRVWKNRINIKDEVSFKSYIFTVTHHLLLNELRSRINNQKTKDKVLKLVSAKDFTNFEETEHEELIKIINLIIEKLPTRPKQIFLLSRTEGLSHKEIAEKLQITTKTVEYHITHCTKHLKKILTNLGLVSLLQFYFFLTY